MRYCHPSFPDPNCALCIRYEREPEFRALLDRVPPPHVNGVSHHEPRPCRDRHPNPFLTARRCKTCHQALHSRHHRELWQEPPLPSQPPTVHRGPIPAAVDKGPCRYGLPLSGAFRERLSLDHSKTWRTCEHPLKPNRGLSVVCPCDGCNARCAGFSVAADLDDTRLLSFDEYNLFPGYPGKRFNSALIEHGDGYAMAWRTGWKGSEIYCARFDRQFRPIGEPHRLELGHPENRYGREDPRLFWFRGQLHVVFVGVRPHPGDSNSFGLTRMFYARLSHDFRVEQVFCLPKFNDREKNWSPIVHDGTLYFTYSYSPHRVLRVNGERCEWAYDTPTPAPWEPGSEIRGGAPGVLHNGELWCWFHAKRDLRPGEPHFTPHTPWYHLGVLVHQAEPPFRVTAISPRPLLWADPDTNVDGPEQTRNYAPVVFPCGAAKRDRSWIVSMGIHDRTTALHEWDLEQVERGVVRIAPPLSWSMRREGSGEKIDYGIWHNVIGEDEYGLKSLNLRGASVLDVGAHVGCFMQAALDRGASVVHCYEPFAEFQRHLQVNATGKPVMVFWSAIGERNGWGDWPSQQEADRTSAWSVVVKEGGQIRIDSLDIAIECLAMASNDGRVNLLKIDCEGAEWPAFSGSRRLDLVDRIVGEWHEYEWHGRRWRREDLAGLLPGFEVTTFPPTDPRATWGLFSAVLLG